jgi:hypothetical protein
MFCAIGLFELTRVESVYDPRTGTEVDHKAVMADKGVINVFFDLKHDSSLYALKDGNSS